MTERKPLGSELSLYRRKKKIELLRFKVTSARSLLTMVYHSIRRGNKGKGIVKAKRSRMRERKTMVCTFGIGEEEKSEDCVQASNFSGFESSCH